MLYLLPGADPTTLVLVVVVDGYWYHYDDDEGSAGKRIFQIASNYESFSNIYETTRFPSGTSSLITTTPKQRMPGAWRRSLQSSTYLPL